MADSDVHTVDGDRLLCAIAERLIAIAPEGAAVAVIDHVLRVGEASAYAMIPVAAPITGSRSVVSSALEEFMVSVLDEVQVQFAELSTDPWPATPAAQGESVSGLPTPAAACSAESLSGWYEVDSRHVLDLVSIPLAEILV